MLYYVQLAVEPLLFDCKTRITKQPIKRQGWSDIYKEREYKASCII